MSKGTIFAKNTDFLQMNADSKIKRALVPKDIFSETAYVLRTKFQVSSIIQNEPLKSPPRFRVKMSL